MTDQAYLSIFTPSRTNPDDLEAIFVQRATLLEDAVERVKESAGTDNKHHLLFVGPRGTGKTHFVTLLVHRLTQESKLNDKLRIAWLNEDETSTTLLEFLHRIYVALIKRYPDEYKEKSLDSMYDLSSEQAERWLINLLLEKLQQHTLLVVVENLDALFDSLGESGQKKLRAFIQEHPVLSIVATAQRLVDDLSKRTSAFFGFFQTEHLKVLTVEQAAELLGKIATLNKQDDVAAFLRTATGRARIRALHHLSGGNHRIYLVLSQFITRRSINALVQPFAKMVDEMTPYYQERIRWLPPQQRKIVEYLCSCERPATVKAISRRLFATPQTISSQLKDLRGKGYVRAAQRGRESLYEIAEPLMRICVEIKENQSDTPLAILVDFLRIWYDVEELNSRLGGSDSKGMEHRYLQSAIEKNQSDGNLRGWLLVEGFRAELGERENQDWNSRMEGYAEASEELAMAYGEWVKGNTTVALTTLAEIVVENGKHDVTTKALAWHLSAEINYKKGDSVQEIADNSAIIDLDGAPIDLVAKAFNSRGVTYGQQGYSEQAIADCSTVIDMKDAPVDQVGKALNNRGVTYGQQGDSKQAIADYSAIIGLEGAPADQVARALYNRGVTYRKQGDSEQAIADCSTVIDLEGAPVDLVAKALFNRGTTYWQRGDFEQEIADYSTVIDLEGAPVDLVAKALINRGLIYGQQGDTEQETANYSMVIDLEGAPVDLVAKALFNRGVTYRQQGNSEQAIADYSSIIDLKGVDELIRAEAHLALAEIYMGDGRWNNAVSSLASGLSKSNDQDLLITSNTTDVISVFFNSSLTPKIRQQRVHELAHIFLENNATALLGEVLIRHLGVLYLADEDLPVAENLELWANAWESACEGFETLRLPLRIFRTGINFLKSGGKDRAILLDLNQEERRILEQALGFEYEG